MISYHLIWTHFALFYFASRAHARMHAWTRRVGCRYPPTLDAELDGADAGLSTLKTQSLEGGVEGGDGEGEGKPDGEEEEEEEHRVLPSTKEERREAKKKLKEEEKKLKVHVIPICISLVKFASPQMRNRTEFFRGRDSTFRPRSLTEFPKYRLAASLPIVNPAGDTAYYHKPVGFTYRVMF